MLNSRALAYLSEVMRRGSLRQAATYLNVDVAAISRQIRQLEEVVEAQVIERHSGGVRLTEAGRLLVDHHHAQHDAEAALISRLSALQGLVNGHVRIAVGEGFIADLISAPMQNFMTAYPGIELEIIMAGVNEAMALVKQRDADLALLYAPPVDAQLECYVETRQPLDLIVPSGHPLMMLNTPVTLPDLGDWPIGLMDSPFGMRQMVDAVAHQERLSISARLHTNSVAVLKNFVRSGIGITFMPELTVAEEVRQGDIAVLPMAYPVLSDARAQIVSLAGRELTVAATACLDHLRRGMRFFNADAPRLLGRI